MDDLERRAMLGDQSAQEECTRKGITLPCPCCGGSARIRYIGNNGGPDGYLSNIYKKSNPGLIMCNKCGLKTGKHMRVCRALAKWNTRHAPPVGSCKNCVYKQKAVINDKGFMICTASGMEITDNDFCSYFNSKEY